MPGYQSLHQRRQFERRRKSKKRSLMVGFAVFVVYVGAFLWIVTYGFHSYGGPLPFLNPDVQRVALSFDWGRNPITRTFAVDIPPPSKTVPTTPTRDLSVRLAGDLVREDGGSEFPSTQITVAANRISDTQLTLAVTANPWTPERVAGGNYSGNIEIRGLDLSIDVPLVATLENRDSPRWCAVAFSVISIGALIGLLVKYITERLTPQAALVRRLGALKRSIGYVDEGMTVPVRVRLRIEELEDNIARSEYASVEDGFSKFDQDKAEIAALSQRVGTMLEQLDRQRTAVEDVSDLPSADRRLLEGTLEAEFRLIQSPLFRSWPEEKAGILAEAQEAQIKIDIAGNAVERFLRSPRASSRRALFAYQRGEFTDAPEFLQDPEEDSATSVEPSSSAKNKKKRTSDPRFDQLVDPKPISWIFNHARTIAALASVVVVSIAGLKTQYLDNQSFEGGVSDWFQMLIWGLVVELSGVSVLEVLGRLTNTSVAPAVRGQSVAA
jgi:HAMP domain-containing protein